MTVMQSDLIGPIAIVVWNNRVFALVERDRCIISMVCGFCLVIYGQVIVGHGQDVGHKRQCLNVGKLRAVGAVDRDRVHPFGHTEHPDIVVQCLDLLQVLRIYGQVLLRDGNVETRPFG